MCFKLYHVNAFTGPGCAGNPAVVCLLDRWPTDDRLQAVAAATGVSETAFLISRDDGYAIRWFTPVMEVALCGHATLASAFVLFRQRGWGKETIHFYTRHSGKLTVTQDSDLLVMDFPARRPQRFTPPHGLPEALGCTPQAVYASTEDLLAVLADEAQVRGVRPDFAALAKFDCRGIIISAPGDRCDFVSRFFAPRLGVNEDPVTGSAHCVLAPYWSGELKKNKFVARQLSARGGELFCTCAGDRVHIAGRAVLDRRTTAAP